MRPSGLKMVELAKQTGTWTALDQVEDLIQPEDLQLALDQANLQPIWEKVNKSEKRGLLEILLNSKKTETRQKNIHKIVTSLQNQQSPVTGKNLK